MKSIGKILEQDGKLYAVFHNGPIGTTASETSSDQRDWVMVELPKDNFVSMKEVSEGGSMRNAIKWLVEQLAIKKEVKLQLDAIFA